MNSKWTTPLWSKKHTFMVLTCDQDMRAFFGRGEFCVFHWMLCHFISSLYWKDHVSSPVMTLSNISALCKRSDEMWSWRCFWSCVKIQGTSFVEIFLIPKSSCTICHTVPLFIFKSSVITLTPNLWSERTNVRTLSTFASVLCVFGCPLLGSSCTSSHPSLNRPCHSKTLNFFIAYSQYANVNGVNVSLALLPIFTKNLMFFRCSRFLSPIFPPTIYLGLILLTLLLGNERFIWSVTHVNASWNMPKRAWVHEFAWFNTPATRCDYSGN